MDAPTLVRRPLQQPRVTPRVESAQQSQLPRRATHLGKQAQHNRATVSSSERKGLPVSDDVGQLLPKGVSLAGPRACVGGPGGELRQVTRGWRHLAWARDAQVARLGRAPAVVSRAEVSKVSRAERSFVVKMVEQKKRTPEERQVRNGTSSHTITTLAGTAAALSDRLRVAATAGAVQQVHVVAGMLAV